MADHAEHVGSDLTVGDLEAVPAPWLNCDVPLVLDVEIDPASAFPIHGRIAQIKNFAT